MAVTRKLALLIDGDNAQASLLDKMLAEASKYGVLTIRRVYGDWTEPELKSWKQSLQTHALQPIQQFRNTVGKNATDSALIIDAMDILYTAGVDGFCIVSSDGDFARLATRIREKNLFVMGIGKFNTPRAFVNACEVFVYTENLSRDSADVLTPVPMPRRSARKPAPETPAAENAAKKPTRKAKEETPAAPEAAPKKTTKKAKDEEAADAAFKKTAKKTKAEELIIKPAPKKTTRKAKVEAPPTPEPLPVSKPTVIPLSEEAAETLVRLFRTAFDMATQDDGWANLGALGQFLRQLDPGFDPRTYGHKQLSALVKAHDELFEIKAAELGSNGVYVRLRKAAEAPRRSLSVPDDQADDFDPFDGDDFGSSSDWFVGYEDDNAD